MTGLLAFLLIALISSPILLWGLNRVGARFSVLWVVSAGAAAAVWSALLWLAWHLPQSISWPVWDELDHLFGGTPWFLLDASSWPLAFAISTVALATLFTILVRQPAIDWGVLGAILCSAGLGLAAVLAASLPALLLSWMALDAALLLVHLHWTEDRSASDRIAIAFSAQAVGASLALLGIVSGRGPVDLLAVPENVSTWLLLAAGVRLGVLPAQPPVLPPGASRPGTGAMLRAASAVSAIALLARLAGSGVPFEMAPLLTTIVLVGGFYAAIQWATGADLLSARHFWFLGAASLSLFAVIAEQPQAAVSWGLVMILSGGLLFSARAARPRLSRLFLLMLVLSSGLPFLPTWPASAAFGWEAGLGGLAAAVIAALLLLGYLRFSLAPDAEGQAPLQDVSVLYFLGLILFPAGLVMAGWAPLIWIGPFIGSGWESLLPLLFSLLFAFIAWRMRDRVPRLFQTVARVVTLGWLYRFFWRTYRASGRGVGFASRLLEGDAAILWALLLLALLVTLFAQLGAGA